MKRIMFCRPGNHFSGASMDCWDAWRDYCKKDIHMMISRKWYPGNCYYVRNKCLRANSAKGPDQVPFQGKVKYDYIMWIDSDIIYEPKQIMQLIDRNVDIVSGLYKTESGIDFTACTDMDEEFYKKNGRFMPMLERNVIGKKDLIEVFYAGMGFMLMKRGVMESLEYPWFRPEWPDIDGIHEFASEDVSFGINIRAEGYKIYVDPTVLVGHEKQRIIY